jgi:hypothetical protein
MGRGENIGDLWYLRVLSWGICMNLGCGKYQVAEENCTVQSFLICRVYCMLLGWLCNGQCWYWRAWCMWWKWEFHTKMFLENLGGRSHLRDQDVDVSIILKWILELWEVRLGTGSMWLRSTVMNPCFSQKMGNFLISRVTVSCWKSGLVHWVVWLCGEQWRNKKQNVTNHIWW